MTTWVFLVLLDAGLVCLLGDNVQVGGGAEVCETRHVLLAHIV